MRVHKIIYRFYLNFNSFYCIFWKQTILIRWKGSVQYYYANYAIVPLKMHSGHRVSVFSFVSFQHFTWWECRAAGSVGEWVWDSLPNLHLACLHNCHVTIHIHCEAIYYSIYQKHVTYFHPHSLNTVKNHYQYFYLVFGIQWFQWAG